MDSTPRLGVAQATHPQNNADEQVGPAAIEDRERAVSCEEPMLATKERPIIMNGRSVRAILEGRKTQTRRVIKPQPEPEIDVNGKPSWWMPFNEGGGIPFWPEKPETMRPLEVATPHGSVGDRLWVRETWHPAGYLGVDAIVEYKADEGTNRSEITRRLPDPNMIDDEFFAMCEGGWRSPIHMPRWASRLLLEITDVRVERLQSISFEDAEREGNVRIGMPYDPIEMFSERWDETNAKRGHSWDSNPWVWVIGFRVVEPAAKSTGGAA